MKQKKEVFKPTIEQASLFQKIDQVIRKEHLYTQLDLQREDIAKRFKIGRHRLNFLLSTYADGQSFPQYINTIRIEKVYEYFCTSPQMPITAIAKEVGLTPANLRNHFKRIYGLSPTKFRKKNM